MTDNEKNSVLVSGSILPTVPNTPTRAGERIATIAEMENIQNPSIGMTIYVEDEGVFYYVTALKSKEINGVTIVNAVIDTYEYAYGKKITTDTPDDELPEDGENPDNGETPDEGGDGTQEPTPEIPGGSTGTTNTTLDALPVGTIMRFNQAPDEKWLPCDGSLVQQEDYPELNCPELNSTDFTDTEGKYITTAGNIKICCSDDVFVIMVGTNNLCYSEDKCKTWNSVNIPTDQYSGTTIISQYVNGMFFFITDTGYCAASGNGKDWNFSKFPNTMNIAHIIYWDNKYRIPSVGNTYHFASDDGISWSAVGNLNNITVYDFAVDNTGMLWCLSSSAVYFRYAFSSSWSNISNTY